MLVLSRTQFDGKNKIIFETSDGPIVLSVGSLCGDKVKLVIDAPRSVRVLRGELSDTDQSKEHANACGAT